jgi:glycolate oxidase FAD binding subunit
MTSSRTIPAGSLAAACSVLREGETADALNGIVPAFVGSPRDTSEAAALLRAAAALDLAVVVRGSGSRLDWGAPLTQCDLVVDTLGMDAVVEHAAGDLVAKVQAGARMNHVLGVLAASGQEIALDVPGAATAGGVVASGLCGPRRLRYGSPRDLLIGITVVRADGTVAKSGGKVVKNVAGYDLGKLFAGSAGTLGLITEVTFRLHPLPAARAFVSATYPADFGSASLAAASVAAASVAAASVAAAVAEAANSPLVASAVELSWPEPSGPVSVGVLIEGSAEGVSARAERMAGLLDGSSGLSGSSESSVPLGSSVSSVQVSASPPSWWPWAIEADGGTLIRLSFWVSALASVLDAVKVAARDSGTTPVVYGSAGAGVLYLALPAETEGVVELVSGLRALLSHKRGNVAVISAPAAVRAALTDRGGMAGRVPSLSLMRAVKDQFDPGHRMAPGRFPEGI